MLLRRGIITFAGFIGSCLAITALYLSVQHGYPVGTGISAFVAKDVLQQDINLRQDGSLDICEKKIALPVYIPETTLILEKLVSYEGPFLEDCSDREVVDVLAVHLYNYGNKELLRAGVEVQFENVVYRFDAEHIPAGKAILILEQNASKYVKCVPTAVNGWQVVDDNEQLDLQSVRICEQDMGTLVVTNCLNRELKNVTIYYKSWLPSPEIYVGGVAYNIKITELAAGETVSVYPYHYAKGFSKVVAVTWD